MKVERTKIKKGTDLSADCKNLIDKLKKCNRQQLKQELARIQSWTFGKCELYHWVDVLDIFDDILGEATVSLDETTNVAEFDLTPGEIELLLLVLNFTTLQIEHSFSRHLYNSVDHLITLLSSFRMDVALGVLNLFYMFSKRSNFIARLSADKKTTLLNRLKFLAENWGFGLANCCRPDSEFNEKFDQGFYYQFYTKDGNLESIEIKNIKQFKLTHTASSFTKHVWSLIVEKNGLLDEDQKFHILSRVRLLWQFDSAKHRLLFVQARLQALSVLVYSDALSEQTHSLIYPGLLEEIVDLIKYDKKSSQFEESLVEIRAAALRTLTSIIHLERNTQYLRKSESRLSIIIDVTGASSYHGFLPSLVRSCINNLISAQDTSASLQKLATALFSFLYHLASYESGAESLVSCGMMEPLLRVINWKSIELDHITFVTRAVRVIDLITNLDMQSFQQLDGLNIFVDRLNIEIRLCRKESPYEIVPKRFANPEESPPHQSAASEIAPIESVESMVFEELEDSPELMVMTPKEEPEFDDDKKPINRVKHYLRNQRSASLYDTELYYLQKKPIGHDNTKTKNTDKACLPQRAALLKSMLNFLKKAIQDSVFSESIRQVMDGSLPNSLKHIISNAEYYGPSLFLLATDVATVYVYHEPSLLSSLQDNGLTDVILQALLARDVPPTREVLGSLPNIFGALCLNERGLNEFLHYRPFDMLSRIFLSPVYLNAMRRRRSAEPGDTAAIFGKAMDDLMRNQTSLKEEAIKAIIKLLRDLRFLGTHPQFVCWRGHKNEAAASSSSHDPSSNSNDLGNGSGDEDDEDEEVTSPQNEVADDFPNEDSINNNDDDDNNDIVMYESEMANVANSDNASSSMHTEVDFNVYPERTPVSLIDYILNVMKFVDAILNSSNNNSTNNDDHCREFIHQNGLNALLSILSLPNLPVTSCNSPITASVQMISTVCKSILSLTQDPQVLRVALEQLNGIIETLDPLLIHLKETKGSVLLRELANCQYLDQAFTCSIYTPILHTMGAVYSYIAMLVLLCRTTQSEMRSSLLMRWAQDERGLALLSKLAQLYEALVWESTLLLALCTDDIIPQDCDFGREDMEKLIKGTTKISNSDVSWEEIVGNLSTIESNEVSVDGPEQTDEEMNIPTGTAATAAFVAAREPKDFDKKRNEQLKYIKSSLGASSRLGRALAELFGILVKSSVALLQRPRRNMPSIPSYISGAAKEISNVLSNVVVEGLKFDKLPESPIPKLKLTFLICSVGFTSAMLFDEKKNSYQLMLSKFVEKDGLDVFFQMFYWVINSGKDEEFLLEGTIEFLDAWIALLEKMTNVKAILETPHGLWDMENQFTPINYLAQIHRMAFQVLTKLWYSNRIYDFGNKTVEIILTIFKHIFKGESVIKEKLKKIEPGEKEGEPAATTSTPNPTTRENYVNQSHLQQLTDMGFNRETAVFALSNSLSLEMATDFLLSQPNLGEIGRTPAAANALATIQTVQNPTENKPTQISNEEIEEFINNVLKMSFELLEKFPGSVHKLCDLMLAIFKRNGEQFRNQSINQILVRIQSDLEVAENILQTMHNIESELYPEHLPARLQFLTLLFEAKNQDMKVPCATIMDDSNFIQIVHNMITLYREMEKRMTKTFRTPKWVAPLFLLIDLYDRASNYGKNKGKLYEITTGKWRWYDVQHGRWKTYYNSNNKVIGTAYWGGEQTVRITADRHHYTINFNCMSQVNEGSGNHRPIIPSLKCMESNEFLKLPEVFGASGAAGGPSGDNTANKSDSNKAMGNLLESSQCAVVLNKIDTSQWLVNDDMVDLMGSAANCPIGEKYAKAILRGIDYQRAEDLIRSCVTLMTTDIDPDTLHSVMKLCVRLTRDYEIAQLFARLGGVQLLLTIKASSSFVGFFSLAALLIRHILEDQTNLEYAMANVLRCKTLSTIPPGYKELFYLTRQISSAVSRSPKVFTAVATKILRITNTIEFSTPESPKLFRGFFLKAVSYDFKTGKAQNEVAVETVHALLAALAKIDYLDNADPKFTPILMRVSILKILTEAVKSYLTIGVMIAEHKLKDNMSAMAFIMDHLLHMNTERECSQMAINLITSIVASMETQPFNMQYKVVFEVKEAFERSTTLSKATDRHGQIESMAILIQSIIDHLSSVDQNIPRSTKHSSVLGIMLEIGLIADIANAIKYLDLSGTQVVQTINHLLKPLELMVRIFNEQCSEDDSNKKKAEKEKESQTQTEAAEEETAERDEPDPEEEDVDEEFPALVEQEQPEDEMEFLEDSNDMDVGERNEEEGEDNEGAEEANQDNNQEERSETGETESNASEEQADRENEAEDEPEDGDEPERSELDVDEETRQFIEIVGSSDQVMIRYHPTSNEREDDNETANNERATDDTFRNATSRFILRRNIVGNDGRSRVNHSGGHVSQILNDMATSSSSSTATTRHISHPHRTFIQHLLPDSSNDSNGSRNIRITTRVRLPRNHSQVLERLFGPLPITTSASSVRGSGRLNGNAFRDATRVVLMDNGFGIVPSNENLSVQMVDQSGYLFGRSLNAQLSNNPTALHWWIEENKILGLESQSELCLIVCDEIFPILQKLRMEEIEKEEKKKNEKNSDEKPTENSTAKGQTNNGASSGSSRSGGILSELLHMIRVTSTTSSTTSTLATPMDQGSIEPVDLNNLNIDNDQNQTDNERENAANANNSTASNNQTTETSRGFDFFNPSFDEDSRNANDEHDQDHDQDEEVQESDASDDILTPMMENPQNYDNESDDGEDEEEEEEDEDGDNGDDDDDEDDDEVAEEDDTARETTIDGSQLLQQAEDVSASTNSSGRVMLGDLEVPEGIDPSFLEAIPDGMRAEVIADYMRLQGLNRPQPPPPVPDPDPDVLAEFMAALPPNIQEELRMDRLRQAASTTNPNEPVDAGAFFQNLPPSLRQSILSDMEDSQISALPPDLAAEAATLRRDWETRNRATLAQATGNPMMRFRNLRTLIPRTGLIHLNPESFSIRSSIQQNLALESYIQRQEKPALDHEALTSILMLLFIDNANLSNVRLFKIIRFLCYHVPTRKWIITTLLSIIQRCSMKPKETADQKRPIPGLSIYLHTALGYKAHVFSIGKNGVEIHPKATTIICRQAVELLIMLAKSFPWQFLPNRKAPLAKKKSSSNVAAVAAITAAVCPTNAKEESQQPSTSYKNQKDKKPKDFWDILSRVGSTKEKTPGPGSVPKEFDESEINTYEESPFFSLINMLAFNSIKISNQLTDKLLRLLSLITFAMPEEDKTKNLAQPNSESHLRIAVDVLTSKSCSEDGLEDATAVLIALSQCSSKAGSLIYSLLIQSAINISDTVHKQIEALCEELQKTDVSPTSDLNDDTAKIDITEREDEEMPSTSSGNAKSYGSSKKGLLEDRFTRHLVVVNAPARIKSSSDLQLLSIEPLTSKTSSQTLFLRILKVITQIRDSLKNDKEKVEPLSTTLNLEELWGTLSVCLKDLEKKSDNHAILILQPVVEAFFIVHSSSQTKRNASETPPTSDTAVVPPPTDAAAANQEPAAESEQLPQDTDIEQNTNNEQNEQPANENAMIIAPVSPISAIAEHPESVQSSSSNTQQNLTADQKKFLLFAETHRIILNQILRQSSVHLADGPFSVLVDHTRVLDFDVKRRYFRTELERLDEGVRRDELQINVRRASVFEDSFRELCRKSPEEWKNRFYIVFEGEEGQDAGGLLREWYVIISRDIFNPMYALFTVSPGDRVTYMINSSSHINPNHLHYFKFVGRLIAKAIYDNKLLECYFTRAFYKHILGIQVKYTDMESEDYDFYKGLVFLLENTVSMLGYDLMFSLEVQEFGVTEVRDLIPNGRHVTVTEENKLDYIHLVCQLKMSGSIKQQLNAFLEGFYDIIPKNLISIFNEQELELLISGLPNIDIEDLRANTEYHKYEVNSRQIQWFWRALRSFNQAERAKFLQFVTGTSKVPLQGFGSLEGMNGTQKFQIHRDDRSTDHLPSAHTCFNQLDLPAYKTYEKLRSCLLKAIQECSEGFAFA